MKLAIICGGRSWRESADEDRQLRHIQGSVVKVRETLEDNGWQCPDTSEIKDERTYKIFLSGNNYHCKNTEEFLFYYTGHGFSNNDTPFRIYLENHSMQFVDLIKATREALSGYPAKIGFVIDACYSGGAINAGIPSNVEILTSTNEDSQAFEKDTYGTSVFTKFFCDAFNAPHDTNEIDLECIGQHVEQEGKNATREGDLDPFHINTPSFRQGRIIVGYVKEINDLKKFLKAEYPDPIDLKNAILQYIQSCNGENFTNIKEANSYDDLFRILMKEGNENIVCCLSKDLAVEYPCPSQYNNCEELKKRAKTSRSVKYVILKIEPVNSGKIDKCKVDGWIDRDDGIYDTIEFSENINFDDDSYRTEFPKCLAKVLGSRELSEGCELKLLLANPLFKKNLYDLEITLLDGFDDPDKLSNVFNIAAKILFRTNFEPSKKWINSSARYKEHSKEKISVYTYLDSVCSDFSTVCSNFNNGYAYSGSHIHYISMVSNCTFLDEKDLKKIIKHGIPIVVCPKNLDEDNIVIDWQNTFVENMKVTTFNYIRNHTGNIHFIHDTYDEAIKLQKRLINKTDKKTHDNFLEG